KVAAAGAGSNLLLALSFALIYQAASKMNRTDFILQLLSLGIYINLLLAFFNLIPFPPLDGSKILFSLLPSNISLKYYRFTQISPFLVLILFWLIWPLIHFLVNFFYRLLLW
ncbi:MAG TPA: site-2 protease family protein, partial [bacterium]|nr:site-2 protease family protein [bacterium]